MNKPAIQTTTTLNPNSSAVSVPSQSATTRPSVAIKNGADLLLELVENEKAALTMLYRNALVKLEKDFRKAHAQAEINMKDASSRSKAQDSKIESLQAQLEQERSDALDRQRELEILKKENEGLKLSIQRAHLHYVDGRLGFDDDTARVVDDFIAGARKQEKTLLSTGLSSVTALPCLQDDRISNPVTPEEFFYVLSDVMARGRAVQEELKREFPALLHDDGKSFHCCRRLSLLIPYQVVVPIRYPSEYQLEMCLVLALQV